MFFNKKEDINSENEIILKYDFIMYSKKMDVICEYKNIEYKHISKNVYHIYNNTFSIFKTIKINKNSENICIILLNDKDGNNILNIDINELKTNKNNIILKDENGKILINFNFEDYIHWDRGIYYIYDSKDKENRKKIAIIDKGIKNNLIINELE